MVMTKADQNEIDKFAGERVRDARKELNISQTTLAAECGITFQQIQKYERGANRISASRLYQIAMILEKPIWYFFPFDASSDAAKYAIKLERKLKRAEKKIDKILAIAAEA